MGNCVLRNTQRRTHEVDTGLAATKGRTRLFAPICCKVFNFGCTRELCRELLKFLVPGTHLQGFRCGRRGHRAVFKARHMIPMCSPAWESLTSAFQAGSREQLSEDEPQNNAARTSTGLLRAECAWEMPGTVLTCRLVQV